MIERAVILNNINEGFEQARVEFMGDTDAVIRIDDADQMDIIGNHSVIRFQILESYEKIYEGNITKVTNRNIYICDVKNISFDLKEDVIIQVSYKSSIMGVSEVLKKKGIDVVVRDISSGGICFRCNEDLAIGNVYEIIIPFTTEPIVVRLKILRKQNINDQGYCFYGCKFVNLNCFEEKMIREAVFRLQTMKYKSKIKHGKED